MLSDWSNITILALQNAWEGIVLFLPKIAAGLVIFGLGWIAASALGQIAARLLKKTNFDVVFQKSGWKAALESADIKVGPSVFVGAVVKWAFVILFLQIAVEIIGLHAFAGFLTRILEWIPNVIVGAAIFVVSIIVADILEKVIRATVHKMEIKYSHLLGLIVRGAIYLFAAMAIMLQLGVASSIINTLIIGFTATISLALGLAFGLGGKDAAADAIKSLRNKLFEK